MRVCKGNRSKEGCEQKQSYPSAKEGTSIPVTAESEHENPSRRHRTSGVPIVTQRESTEPTDELIREQSEITPGHV